MNDDAGIIPKPSGAGMREIGEKWLGRISRAEQRKEFQEWQKAAREAEDAYLCGFTDHTESQEYDFPIFHSNVETIGPAIYNSVPIPDIRDRHGIGDPVAAHVGEVFERVISIHTDNSRLGRELRDLRKSALIAGRGMVRVRFDADEEVIPAQMGQRQVYDETGALVVEEFEIEPERVRYTNERILFESVPWDSFRHGPGSRWTDVTWCAFKLALPTEEIDRITDHDMASAQLKGNDEKYNSEKADEETDVWEIWCKTSRTVKFIRADNGIVLAEMDDPLELTEFFPFPQPVQPIDLGGRLCPVVPYATYKQLAIEVDQLTTRIDALIDALKAKGAYPGSMADIAKLAAADELMLTSVDGLEALAQTGRIDQAIMWWPIEQIAAVIMQCYDARDRAKQAIYEITGIADIVRGASDPRETLGAQQMKEAWGGLRIRDMQSQIEWHARDLFQICAEVISLHFSPESIMQQTGMQLDPEHLELIKSPAQRYRIDVESDSTVRNDVGYKQDQMGQFLRGTSEFFGVMAPLIQQEPAMAKPIAQMYASFVRTFNIGRQAEDAVDQLAKMAEAAGQQERPDPEEEKAKAEAQATAQKLQLEMQKLQASIAESQARMQMDQREMQREERLAQHKIAIEQQELALKEKQAEFDAIVNANELELEEKQRRPVGIG